MYRLKDLKRLAITAYVNAKKNGKATNHINSTWVRHTLDTQAGSRCSWQVATEIVREPNTEQSSATITRISTFTSDAAYSSSTKTCSSWKLHLKRLLNIKAC